MLIHDLHNFQPVPHENSGESRFDILRYILLGCRETAGMECMVGSAMYFMSTGISLQMVREKD